MVAAALGREFTASSFVESGCSFFLENALHSFD